MSTKNCWRCLLRPSTQLRSRPGPFCTTASYASKPPHDAAKNIIVVKPPATGVPKGHVISGKNKQSKSPKTKTSFNNKSTRTKAPEPGERKAFRKRIQLSNNNALAVSGLAPLEAATMAQSTNVGRVCSVPDALIDQLRAVQAFKPTQSWGFFRQPSTLLRSESVALAEKLKKVSQSKETLRIVIDGEKVSGKSTLLLQAMAHGFLNDWVVISIPDAQELTNGANDYATLPTTDPRQYSQPEYCVRLLESIRKANEELLSRLERTMDHPALHARLQDGKNLFELASAGKDPENAWPVFLALWAELTSPKATRPPILFTIDGLAHIMRVSDYRSPEFEPVHSHDIALVRHFVNALSGTTEFPHGAAVLAATTSQLPLRSINTPASKTLDLALTQRLAEQGKMEVPAADPFARYDERIAAALKTVEVLKLSGVSKTEARSLMEYWAASGMFRNKVDTRTVADRWALGGHGIVGEMEKVSLENMRM